MTIDRTETVLFFESPVDYLVSHGSKAQLYVKGYFHKVSLSTLSFGRQTDQRKVVNSRKCRKYKIKEKFQREIYLAKLIHRRKL